MNISITIDATPEEVEAVLRVFRRENVALPAFPLSASAFSALVDGPKQKRVPAKEAEHLEPTTPMRLIAGNTAWVVEIDGLPTRWMLDYSKGQFPAVRGGDVTYQGKRYRISHIYNTSLKLTSMDAETYETQGTDGFVGSEALHV